MSAEAPEGPRNASPGPPIAPAGGPRKVYRVSPLRRAIPPGVMGCFALATLLVSIACDAQSRRALIAVSFFLVGLGALLYLMVWYPRLELCSTGIRLRQIGWGIRTTWDNVADVELKEGGEAFILREPLTGAGKTALSMGRYIPAWYTPEQMELVAKGLWFPLGPFAWHLRHGKQELLEDLKRYLPRLFT